MSYEALNNLYISHHAFLVLGVCACGALHSKNNKRRTERKKKKDSQAIAQIPVEEEQKETTPVRFELTPPKRQIDYSKELKAR